MRELTSLASLLAAVTAVGCGLITGPNIEVLPARIALGDPAFSVPDSVESGVPFTLRIPVYERGCGVNELSATVGVEQQVTVKLWERVEWRREESACGQGLGMMEVVAVWPHPGPFTLVVAGVDERDSPVAIRYDVDAPSGP